MPYTAYDDDELGLTPGWDEHLDPNIRREIRAAKVTQKENEALRTQVATFERERTLSRAGIPQDERGELFARTYEGPTDDPEAVRTKFESLFGPIAKGSEGEGNEPDPAAGDRRVAEAAAAGGSEGQPGVVDLADAIRNAKDADEVKRLVAEAAKLTTWQPGQMIPRLPEDV